MKDRQPSNWSSLRPKKLRLGRRDSTPLCPAGHLPRKGGDRRLRRFRQSPTAQGETTRDGQIATDFANLRKSQFRRASTTRSTPAATACAHCRGPRSRAGEWGTGR
ncbi:MAG: hypothetical protein EOQ47_28595 [Mesorhizobium sp.]|nr:MAG: hypothetical protein EOQ47_28595 [Mesorhizobium sp.]